MSWQLLFYSRAKDHHPKSTNSTVQYTYWRYGLNHNVEIRTFAIDKTHMSITVLPLSSLVSLLPHEDQTSSLTKKILWTHTTLHWHLALGQLVKPVVHKSIQSSPACSLLSRIDRALPTSSGLPNKRRQVSLFGEMCEVSLSFSFDKQKPFLPVGFCLGIWSRQHAQIGLKVLYKFLFGELGRLCCVCICCRLGDAHDGCWKKIRVKRGCNFAELARCKWRYNVHLPQHSISHLTLVGMILVH